MPDGCQEWDYVAFDSGGLVRQRSKEILVELRTQQLDTLTCAADTRSTHGRLFDELTPPEARYFAGHYRGEAYKCLLTYEVEFDGNDGCPASLVGAAIDLFASRVARGISGLDAMHSPESRVTNEVKLLTTVAFACSVMVGFFRIHPYANGNGHSGRFITWAILTRYGYWPARWTIDPRPEDAPNPEPTYTELIRMYVAGDTLQLERRVLGTLAAWGS